MDRVRILSISIASDRSLDVLLTLREVVLANDLILSSVLRVPGEEVDLFQEFILMEFQLSHCPCVVLG